MAISPQKLRNFIFFLHTKFNIKLAFKKNFSRRFKSRKYTFFRQKPVTIAYDENVFAFSFQYIYILSCIVILLFCCCLHAVFLIGHKLFLKNKNVSWFLIRRHMPLYALTRFWEYLGSIINYAAVGGAILYLSKAEGRGEAEISALIARGSYSCLYLIDAFSQVSCLYSCRYIIFMTVYPRGEESETEPNIRERRRSSPPGRKQLHPPFIFIVR